MKKYVIAIALSLLSLPFFLLCNNDNKSYDNGDEKIATVDSTATSDKILVVFFSRAGENYSVGMVTVGNTAVMAGYIADYTGGDVFEIVHEMPYPQSYNEMLAVSQQETANNARPAIKNTLQNLADYKYVFVGSPVWYSAPPMIMRTFYDTYDLSDKTIIPFGTSEGSGIGSLETVIKSYFPNATYLQSLGVRGSVIRNSRNDVNNWLNGLGFKKTNQ